MSKKKVELSKGFVRDVLKELEKLGVPSDNILVQSFNGMLPMFDKENLKKAKLGEFELSKAGLHLLFAHRSGDFSMKIDAGAAVDQRYSEFTNDLLGEAMPIILGGVKLFCVLALQNPTFFHAYNMWQNKWFESQGVELTKEQDDQILKEEKEIYENNQKIKENE